MNGRTVLVKTARGPGLFVGKSIGLVIERLRVQIPAGVVVEFSYDEFTFCADS